MKNVIIAIIAVASAASIAGTAHAGPSVETLTLQDSDFFVFAPISIDSLPEIEGTVVETRVDLTIEPLKAAQLDNMLIGVTIPLTDPTTGEPDVRTLSLSGTDLGLVTGGGFQTASIASDALNGMIFHPSPTFWSVEIGSVNGLFEFFGEGSLSVEVDYVPIPSPGALTLLGVAAPLALRRRR